MDANDALSVSDSVSESDKKEKCEKKNVNEVKRFKAPTIEQAKEYFADKGYMESEAERFVDLKTTDSCENNHFECSAKKYGYKLQAGMYREGVFQSTFEEYGFKFVAVEKKPPYAVRIYNCTPEYIDQGYDKFRELIGIYHDCKVKDEWLGYDRIGAREVDLLADDYVE